MRLKYDYYLLNKKQVFIVHCCPKTGTMFGSSILISILIDPGTCRGSSLFEFKKNHLIFPRGTMKNI